MINLDRGGNFIGFSTIIRSIDNLYQRIDELLIYFETFHSYNFTIFMSNKYIFVKIYLQTCV